MERVVAMRTTELKNVRRLVRPLSGCQAISAIDTPFTQALLRGVMTAIMAFMPILAAILTFVTYSLSGHNLDAATIFSSLQLFNTIKDPICCQPGQIALQPQGSSLQGSCVDAAGTYPASLLAPSVSQLSQSHGTLLILLRLQGHTRRRQQ